MLSRDLHSVRSLFNVSLHRFDGFSMLLQGRSFKPSSYLLEMLRLKLCPREAGWTKRGWPPTPAMCLHLTELPALNFDVSWSIAEQKGSEL